MNRTEFIIATAIILFSAFLLGWFAKWLVSRFSRVTPQSMDEMERMAQRLHHAEEERDRAVMDLERREADLTERLATNSNELRSTLDRLREAQTEIEELRDYIDRKLAKKTGA